MNDRLDELHREIAKTILVMRVATWAIWVAIVGAVAITAFRLLHRG